MEDAAEFLRVLESHLPALHLDSQQINLLCRHFELLLRWNQKINLTSVRKSGDVIEVHYCESLFLATQLPSEPHTCVDYGSGAGFPGVPIAVSRPSWQVSLVEAHQRKAAFLRESARGMGNVRVAAVRGESLTTPCDWLVSRAVRPAEIVGCGRRIAKSVGLLLSLPDAEILRGEPGISWNEPILIPWSREKACLLGTFHVEHPVGGGADLPA
jgi:16S rRNA (guanine527-N7)-methyltransferase